MNLDLFIGLLLDKNTVDDARVLVPEYDFFQKDPWQSLDKKKGDCKATALIISALGPELRFVKSVTKPIKPSSRASSAYVHYLALDPINRIALHSTGAPISEGKHIKAVHISDYPLGWSKAGEAQAKPQFALTMLAALCGDSIKEERHVSGSVLTMTIEDPQDFLNNGTMEELAASAKDQLRQL